MLRLPGPVRPFVLVVLGALGIAAVVVLIASLAGTEPPVWFAAFYGVAWLWNAYWWAWQTPLRVEVHEDGRLCFISAVGRGTEVPPGALRSAKLSVFGVVRLRHAAGSVWLLPVAPVAQLVAYMRAERPEVEVSVPDWAMRARGWPWAR